MHDGIVYTADSIAGLRAWSSKKDCKILASINLGSQKDCSPTSLDVDIQNPSSKRHRILVGFQDGHFSMYELRLDSSRFIELYHHPKSSNGMLSAVAYASPYLVTMTEAQLLSLYKFPGRDKVAAVRIEPQDVLGPPQLLYSLRSHTVCAPLSLTIRPSLDSIVASIAYSVPTYLSGWSVGIQEMRLTSNGELIESRLASAANDTFHSLSRGASISSPSTRPSSPILMPAQGSSFGSRDAHAKPTSLSYSHPYLLVSHPDNTLTLYLVTSTSASLSIGSGSRLWGHTSSISGAHVGGRGKAVSVSSHGDELRVWELEGGMASAATRRNLVTGKLSVRLRPKIATSSTNLDVLSDAILQRGSGLGLALEHRFEDISVTRGWVGFDDENVIVLREKSQGSQALVVYDFT